MKTGTTLTFSLALLILGIVNMAGSRPADVYGQTAYSSPAAAYPSEASPTPTTILGAAPTTTYVPPVFHLRSVRAQRSHVPDWNLKGPRNIRIRVRQPVRLAMYIQITQLLSQSKVSCAWLVTRDGITAAHHGKHFYIRAGSGNGYWAYWDTSFSLAGSYTVQGTVMINGQKQLDYDDFTVSE